MPLTLGQLPDELLLAIIETIPQFAKVTQTTQLFNICLVSKRLARIAESVLYSSITVQIHARSAYQRLFCLLSALTQKPAKAKHIRYLHGSPSPIIDDCHGDIQCCHTQGLVEDRHVLMQLASRFWRQPLLEDWDEQIRRGSTQAVFALVVKLSPHISHLCIKEPLNRESILKFLLPDDTPSTAVVSNHGFSTLTTLILSGSEYASELDRYVTQFLRTLPALQHYRHAYCRGSHLKWIQPGFFERLVTILLPECQLTVRQVAEIIPKCHKLREFSCVWSYACRGQESEWLQLITAFQSIRQTLETLELRFTRDELRFSRERIFPECISQSTALTSLLRLQSLSLSAYMLLGHRRERSRRADFIRPKLPISQCLPRNLERFSIQSDAHHNRYRADALVTADQLATTDCDLALWDFADEIHLFPALREISIYKAAGAPFRTSRQKSTELVKRFAEKGVTFLPPEDA